MGFLLAAPVAAEDVVRNQQVSISGPIGVNSEQSGVVMSEDERAAMRLVHKMVSLDEAGEFFGGIPIPAAIASKKSWSPAFKEREAIRLEIERRHRRISLQDIAYGDGSYVSKLAKLYAMGLGVNK